jgi:hypothetical protein
MKSSATVAEILATHTEAVAQHLATVPGREIVVLRDARDIHNSQARLEKLKADFRKQRR